MPTEPAPPTIVTPPASIEVGAGDTATFTVSATGSGLHYQWMRNRVSLAGATSEHSTTGPLNAFDSGVVFSVIVYNRAGVVSSNAAVLTVMGPPDAGLPDAGSNALSVNWGDVPGAWSFGYAVYDGGGHYAMVLFDVVTRTTGAIIRFTAPRPGSYRFIGSFAAGDTARRSIACTRRPASRITATPTSAST